MRLCHILSGCILLYLSTYSHAENCSASFRPNFDFQVEEADIYNAIHEVDAGWQGRWKDMSLQDRLVRQESMIARISADHVRRHSVTRGKTNCMTVLPDREASALEAEHAGARAVTLLNRHGNPDAQRGMVPPC